MLLESIKKPNDIKKIEPKDYNKLAEEIRQFLIHSISKTGGHLGSNLGVVELTMALHLALDLPKDKIVWDVKPTASTAGPAACRLLRELLELVEDELHLRSDDDLDAVLARADDARAAGRLDLLLVNQQAILHLKTQTGDAVIDRSHVLLAAAALEDDGRHRGEVIVAQLDLGLGVLIVLTARGLQIPLGDGELEHEIEHDRSSQAHRDDQPGVGSRRQGSGEDQVGQARGEAEAGAEAQRDGDSREDAVQSRVDNIQRERQEHEGELERLGNAAQEGTNRSSAESYYGKRLQKL